MTDQPWKRDALALLNQAVVSLGAAANNTPESELKAHGAMSHAWSYLTEAKRQLDQPTVAAAAAKVQGEG